MIQYFWGNFQPSVQVEIEQRGRELNNFKEIVKKAIDAKAKAIFRPYSYAYNIDQYCF